MIFQVCSGLFEDANKSLDEMDREAKGAPLQFRAEMLANVRRMRKEVNSLQSQFTKARMQRPSTPSSYGAAGGFSGPPVQDQYRQQVRHSKSRVVPVVITCSDWSGVGWNRNTVKNRRKHLQSSASVNTNRGSWSVQC